MQVKLIPATEMDREFFRKAHHLAYRDVIEPMFGWDDKKQDHYADTDFNDRNPHLIQQENNSVGVIGWQEKEDHIWFGPIFVLPEFQSKGIGSLLIKQFIKDAKVKNIALRLQTLKMNEGAKKLYERLGFRVLSSNEIHWQMEYNSFAK
jgi:ribosomal protein S18 acetylase RimI-like enzyme